LPPRPGAWACCPNSRGTLIHRALELDDVSIREIMTPRQKIFSLPSDMLLEEASALVIARHRSRVPVYDESAVRSTLWAWFYARDLARLIFFRSHRRRHREPVLQGLFIPGPHGRGTVAPFDVSGELFSGGKCFLQARGLKQRSWRGPA